MLTEQTQRDHDEAAHGRLAEIRAVLNGLGGVMQCAPGSEVEAVKFLAQQYRLIHAALDQIEHEADQEEAEALSEYRSRT